MEPLSNGSGRRAFGAPGIEPRWTHGAKDGAGCAYSASSLIWFTLSRGVVSEIYYPTIDTPQVRDVQFLVTDGETFAHDEKRSCRTTVEKISPDVLGYRTTGTEHEGRYRLVKEIIADPHAACLLIRVRLECENEALAKKLHLYVLVASHLDGNGWGDSAFCRTFAGREMLAARGDRTWMMVGAGVPFLRRSVGYVGSSDGWQDVMEHRKMEWEFDEAPDGNVAMCGELDLSKRREFTVGVAFGHSDQNAASTLFQSLGTPWKDHRARFIRQWERATAGILPLDKASSDGGRLYHASRSLLLSHEDKSFPGALIASLSIPWGDVKGDEEGLGGYHLVWTRDMCNSSSGLMAAGDLRTPLRSLIYLACTQRPDGGFYQNFWIDGRPYWHGIQLDEVSFPIVLAWRLAGLDALGNFDPFNMVMRAARYLIDHGPSTPQERWEENSGYSPSTLASNIAGLVCAAEFARKRGDAETAEFILAYADFLESHVEQWTVTTQGELLPGVPRHYIRIHPVNVADRASDEDPNRGVLGIRNRPPGTQVEFPARNIVDAGFLELARYGIRKAGSALMEDSLRVVDAVLRVETPMGPVWRRYNEDGYGETADAKPYHGWGVGRAWPLLTGERGHYELAAGRDPAPYIRALEQFANVCGLLPEQVWDQPDRPKKHFFLGKPTGAAMPLMWAHAEYIKLVRSRADGRVFDLLPPVADRYLEGRGRKDLEVWKFNRRVRKIAAGATLRVQSAAAFTLRVSLDGWQTSSDLPSTATKLGIHYADVATAPDARAPVAFTFFWPEQGKWEGADFSVELDAGRDGPGAQEPRTQKPASAAARPP